MNTLIDIAQTVATGGAATAVIVVVRMFLAHLQDERRDRERSRHQFLQVITNDLAHQRRTLAELARTIAELNSRLRTIAVIDRTVGDEYEEEGV